MRRIAAVAQNTFREAARNKVMYSLLLFAIILIVSALALGELSVHEERRMIRDVGLFGIDVFSVLIAIFVGVNLLYKELSLKTVYTILPKPIARWEFVLGKWLGVMATLVAQIAVMGVVLALTLVASHSGGADARVDDGALDAALPKALWLFLMNVTIVTSVAMLFSAFTSPFLSGVFSLGIFLVGRQVPELQQLATRIGGMPGDLLGLASRVLPNLHLFTPSGTIVGAARVSVHGQFVGAAYLGSVTAYALCYSALVLGLAMLIFRRRDFV
ncbi:MAG: ABC transporter permease [Deltaproteobacteria bacterium]|nr:ABC transporter permease [Deltaproteobacteria bacterium]